jgi:hypothetical protein
MAAGDRDGVFTRQRGSNGGERKPQIRESLGQMTGAESFERISVQQLRPEDGSRQLRQILPTHSGRDARANHTPGAGTGNNRWPNTRFRQDFVDADVSQAAYRAAAQGQSDSLGVMLMQTAQLIQLYSGDRR